MGRLGYKKVGLLCKSTGSKARMAAHYLTQPLDKSSIQKIHRPEKHYRLDLQGTQGKRKAIQYMESSTKLPPSHSGRLNVEDSSGECHPHRNGSLDRVWKRPSTSCTIDHSPKEPGCHSYIPHCRPRKYHSFLVGLEDSTRTPHPRTLEARLGGLHGSSHTSTHQDN